jgi:hypothetical protein
VKRLDTLTVAHTRAQFKGAMRVPDRPPLHEITCEQIDMLLHRVDERHWLVIAKMRVPKYIPPSVPVPPQAPLHLLNNLNSYASELFRAEADNYEQFRSDGRYPAWLSKLAGRVVTRVLDAVDKIEHGDSIFGVQVSTLGYHGVTQPEMEKFLRDALWDETHRYTQRDTGPRVRDEAVKIVTVAEPQIRVNSESSEPISAQIRRLKAECDITAEELAVALKVETRSIHRHLSGEAMPRRKHLAIYESLFSQKLGRPVTLKKSPKRQ